MFDPRMPRDLDSKHNEYHVSISSPDPTLVQRLRSKKLRWNFNNDQNVETGILNMPTIVSNSILTKTTVHSPRGDQVSPKPGAATGSPDRPAKLAPLSQGLTDFLNICQHISKQL